MPTYDTTVRGFAGDLFTFGAPHATLDAAKMAARAKWDGLPADRKQEVVVLFRSSAVFWIDPDGEDRTPEDALSGMRLGFGKYGRYSA